MPVYYFDAWNGDRIASDNKGVECADDQTVCSAAAQALLDLAREVVDGTRRWELALDVSDAEKKPVCRVSLQFESEQKAKLLRSCRLLLTAQARGEHRIYVTVPRSLDQVSLFPFRVSFMFAFHRSTPRLQSAGTRQVLSVSCVVAMNSHLRPPYP